MNPVRVVCALIEFATSLMAIWWFFVATRDRKRSEFWRSLALLMFVVTLSGRAVQTIDWPTSWAVVSLAIASIMAMIGFALAHRESKLNNN